MFIWASTKLVLKYFKINSEVTFTFLVATPIEPNNSSYFVRFPHDLTYITLKSKQRKKPTEIFDHHTIS